MSEDEKDDAESKIIHEYFARLQGLLAGTRRECIHCGQAITKLEKVGRCVYAEPCGCRQYQGTVPDSWKAQA